MDLPNGFCQRMTQLLGEEAPSFFRALENQPSRAFRFDPKKVSKERLFQVFSSSLKEEILFCEDAYRFEYEGVGNLSLHHSGAIYVQEPAAMAPVAALGKISPGAILDLCAAPGGKSLQAARLLSEGGVIVCNEPDDRRRRVLMQNLERCGLKNCQVTGFDARHLPKSWKERFDLVICDAPCSGEGMMRKSREAVETWSEENITLCAKRQEEILEMAWFALAPGGTLLYSTCTWAPEENEERVFSLLKKKPDLHLVSPTEGVLAQSAPGISLPDCPFDLSLTRRFYPHRFDGEGQFLAVMKKDGEKPKEKKKKEKEKSAKVTEKEKIARAFLEEQLSGPIREKILFRGEDLYLVPQNGLPAEETVSPGVLVGTVQKGRVVPHHRFFLAFSSCFRRKYMLPPEDARAEAYLRGEEIPLEGENGWGVLFSGEMPLGGVKLSLGRGKNQYPKGLRKVSYVRRID